MTMLPRAEKKQLTRQALLGAAIGLMSEGRGFCSLSLREVTRDAGVVPTAFYRHFRDMDHLGLALVEFVGHTLKEALLEVRRHELELGGAIDASVKIFLEAVQASPRDFMFLAREQYGGSPVVRQAISQLTGGIAADLSRDLETMPKLKHLNKVDLDLMSDLVVKTVFSTLPELVDPPAVLLPGELDPGFRLTQKLRFIMMGAKHWRGLGKPAVAANTPAN